MKYRKLMMDSRYIRHNTYRHNTIYNNKEILGISFVFLYVFSFYVFGPITSSIVGAILIFPTYLKKSNLSFILKVFQTKYVFSIFAILFLLITLCVLYSTIHLTHDFSYLKILIAQFVHLVCGVLIICWLFQAFHATVADIIRWIIISYIVQSIIELSASFIPSLASSLLYFNHADKFQESTNGVRGLALSSGTTWNLGLTYGIVFILYLNKFTKKVMHFNDVLGFMILVVGTFFAGRTGFVGACIGIIYILLFSSHRIKNTIKFSSYLLTIISILCLSILALFPNYVEYALTNLLPWALEPVFNLMDDKGLSSKSTDRLAEMWQEIPTFKEAILGTGHFTNEDGSYYRHVDVGYLRNLFYWGIIGYLFLIIYQSFIILPILKAKQYRNITLIIFIYLFIAEYKAMTIGFNKMAISILLLMSLTQYLSVKWPYYQ